MYIFFLVQLFICKRPDTKKSTMGVIPRLRIIGKLLRVASDRLQLGLLSAKKRKDRVLLGFC